MPKQCCSIADFEIFIDRCIGVNLPRMTYLPLELIIFAILTRLPAHAVARCKAVCKAFRNSLLTTEFEQAHCSASAIPANQKTILIVDSRLTVYPIDFSSGEAGPARRITFPVPTRVKDVRILGHLDGLLCVCLPPTGALGLWNGLYKQITDSDGHGWYTDICDTLGFYKAPSKDYCLLHLKRTPKMVEAQIYSRASGVWRNVPFDTKLEYTDLKFYWSPGTLCGTILYFTVCECWVVGRNVVVGFDTLTEKLKETCFPPVTSAGIFQGVLLPVRDTLHMVLVTGFQDMILSFWCLQDDEWVSLFSCPPIPAMPLGLWLTITHYMTNGMLLVMCGPIKLHEIPISKDLFRVFLPGRVVSWSYRRRFC